MSEKTDYELAIDDFNKADKAYLDMQKYIEEGQFFKDLSKYEKEEEKLEQWSSLWEKFKDLLEERNVKRRTAADLLRQKVTLDLSKWRGPDARATYLEYGPFKVTSITKRRFDPWTLFELSKKKGVYDKLMELKGFDKDGKEYKLVDHEWSIDYEKILLWLRSNGHDDIVKAAYDEREGTPQVKGPKDLAFIGDKKVE